MKSKRKMLIKILLVLILLGGGFGGYKWYHLYRVKQAKAVGKEHADQSKVPDRIFTLKRDDLVLGTLQSGTVNAQKKHKLSLQASFNTKLAWVIAENTQVKKGDLLAEFETEDLIDRIDDLKIQVENHEKELAVQLEEEKITISSNRASIKEALDKVVDTENNLRKYRRIERSKERDKLELAVDNYIVALDEADSTLRKKKNDLSTSSGSQDEQEKNKQELAKLESKIETEKNNLSNAERDLTLFKRYSNPSKIISLENALAQAQLNNERVKIQTNSSLINKRRHISNIRRNLRNTRTRLERHQSYLDMMKLEAPVDGVVIYGDPDARWGNVEIKLGMDVGKNRILMTIPDMKNLVVDFDLPEQLRSKVTEGNTVIITPDSLNILKVHGKISQIDTLPVNQSYWDRNSPKIYKSVVRFDEQHPQLVSGMSVQVNIVTKTLKDILYIPVEAVFEDKDRFIVYKRTFGAPQEVTVKIGESNDSYVHILEGLHEGDEVYLYRPFQKKGQENS
jgi:HlyD family secretion protein